MVAIILLLSLSVDLPDVRRLGASYHLVPKSYDLPNHGRKKFDIVARARADVAKGLFGRQIEEHGNRLKTVEGDRFEQWHHAGLKSPLTLRAAHQAITLENAKTGSHWALVRIADAKQWAHMGLVYEMKLDLCKQSDAEEDCVHGKLTAHEAVTADITLLWKSWAKPAYSLHKFDLSSRAEHFAHPLPLRGHYTHMAHKMHNKHHMPPQLKRLVHKVRKLTPHEREIAKTAYIKKLQGVLKLYSHYKSNTKYKKLAAKLETLCHADTLGTCRILGCSKWRNAKCVGGKCTCDLGTCAKQHANGKGFTCAKDGW